MSITSDWTMVELVVDIHAAVAEGDMPRLMDVLARLHEQSPEDAAAMVDVIRPRLLRLRQRAA